MNSAGDLAFSSTQEGKWALFAGSAGNMVEILKEGDQSPMSPDRVLSYNTNPAINDAGHIATWIGFGKSGERGGITQDAIYLFEGDAFRPLISTGQAIQGELGTVLLGEMASNNANVFRLNNANDLVVLAGFRNGPFAQAILFSDGTSVSKIVAEGDAVPGGNGVFEIWSSATTPSLEFNDAGQIVFEATIDNTAGGPSDDHGVYFYDPTRGLIEVAREGMPLLGSTIGSLDFKLSTRSRGNGGSGFNEAGQVAYQFTLTDGRQGIALWSMDELPGDYDGNGIVDLDDYQVWKADFGSVSDLQADGNADFAIDLADYTTWRDNLGSVLLSASTAIAVPEQASGKIFLLLLTLGWIGLAMPKHYQSALSL
jgi:hypothetical protein